MPAVLFVAPLTGWAPNELGDDLAAHFLLYWWLARSDLDLHRSKGCNGRNLHGWAGRLAVPGKKVSFVFFPACWNWTSFICFQRRCFSLASDVNMHITLVSCWKNVRAREIRVTVFYSIGTASKETRKPPSATLSQFTWQCWLWYGLRNWLLSL